MSHHRGTATGGLLGGLLLLCGSAWALPAAPVHYAVAARTPVIMTLTGHLTLAGAPAPAGVEVAVYDPQGVRCGASGVDAGNGGAFTLHVYGDDPTTAAGDGPTAGDALGFEVWDPAGPTTFTHAQLQFDPASFSGGTAPPAYPPPFADRAAYSLDLAAGTNRAPVASAGSLTTAEDTPQAGVLRAADPDGDMLTFSLVPGQGPQRGAVSITDPDTGAFLYTPNPDVNGTDAFAFRASDGALVSDPATVTVAVAAVNDPPVLSPIGTRTVGAGQTLSFTVSATDVEGDALTYAADPLPAGATFAAATGAFSWTPATAQAGGVQVTFRVTDDGSPPGSDSEAVPLVVTGGAVNQPPELASIGAKSVSEGAALTFTVTASDPDGTTPLLTATGLPTGATFAAGVFQWTPDYDQAGRHTVTFTASDEGLTDSEAVVITVTDVNRAPVFAASGAKTVEAGATLTFEVIAADPDGDPVTVSAAGLPAGAEFTGGSFTWTPSQGQVGSYSITFTATDGTTPVSQTVPVSVTHRNRAPAQPAIASLAALPSDPLCRFAASLSPFADPDAGARLTAVRWEIWQEVPDLANVSRLDLDLATLPTELALPLGTLAPATPYRVAVSYRDEGGTWSAPSEAVDLLTANDDPRDLDGDGIQDDAEVAGAAPPPGTVAFQDPVTGTRIELTPPPGTTVTLLYVTGRADLAAEVEEQLPADAQIPFGLFSFRLVGVTPGDSAAMRFVFPGPLPPDTAWFKVSAEGTVTDFSAQVLFSPDRLSATLSLRDGDAGDSDGLVNGAIVDPSGPVTGTAPLPTPADTGGGGSGGGCFLDVL